MATEHTVHVEFARVADRLGALRMLRAHGLTVTDAERTTIEIGCRQDEAERILDEVSHALDEWLRGRGLPFTAARTDARTLFVRPPSD